MSESRVPANGERLEPTTATAGAANGQAWLEHAVRFGKLRLGALGLTFVLGFGAGVLALYGFAELAENMLQRETQELDDAVLAWLQRFSSPTLDLIVRAPPMARWRRKHGPITAARDHVAPVSTIVPLALSPRNRRR